MGQCFIISSVSIDAYLDPDTPKNMTLIIVVTIFLKPATIRTTCREEHCSVFIWSIYKRNNNYRVLNNWALIL